MLANKAVSDGVSDVTGTYEAGNGTGPGDNAQATHTEPYVGVGSTVVLPGATILYTVPLVSTAEVPTETGSASSLGSTSAAGSATSTATGTAVTTSATSGARRRVNPYWRW